MSEPTKSESIKLLGDIHAELKAIHELLAAAHRASAAPSRASSSSSSGGTTGSDAPPPQPTQLVENPGDVQVHFGKNNGVPLRDLSERSVAFYASAKQPRLDSSGKPYPPRPVDVALENAARQIYHTSKGTLQAGGTAPTPAPASAPSRNAPPSRAPQPAPKPAAQENLDEDVPF